MADSIICLLFIFATNSDLIILIRHTHSCFSIDKDLLQISSNATFSFNRAEI